MRSDRQRPCIGLTLDSEAPGGYSKLPWYALRQNYFEAIVRAGGLPIALPHEPEQAGLYADMIDGLLVTGARSTSTRRSMARPTATRPW